MPSSKISLPAFDSKTLGKQATVTVDLFSRLLSTVAIQIVGSKTATNGKNYTGKTGATVTALTGTGTGAAGTLTVSASGVPTAFTVTAGGSGWAVGDLFQVWDSTGTGFVGKVATLSTTAMATATVNPGDLAAKDVIDYVIVEENGIEKMKLDPILEEMHESILNGNDDAFDASYLVIRFFRYGKAFSFWDGGADGKKRLQIKVKLKNSSDCPAGATLDDIRGVQLFVPDAVLIPQRDRYVQGIFYREQVVSGWNVINDLAYDGIHQIPKLIFAHPAIEEVEVYVGESLKYQATKDDALMGLQRNEIYKAPAAASDPSDGFFPVIFDDFGTQQDYLNIIEGGIRRPVRIRFKWSTQYTPEAFDIFAEAVESGAPAPVVNARA